MRKLKLESLHVESFETTTGAPRTRGTVQGNAAVPVQPGTGVSECIMCQPWSNDQRCVPQTYDVYACGDTRYFDCTYGCTVACSDRNSCGIVCYVPIDRSAACPIGEPVEGP